MVAIPDKLAELEDEITTPRQVAMLRIRLIDEDGVDLASVIVPMLREALDSFLALASSKLHHKDCGQQLSTATETALLRRVLQIHLKLSKMDPIISEELGRKGSHAQLLRLINHDLASYNYEEEDQDTIIELQDLACEIALYGSFPLRVSPFTTQELRQRLPLAFTVNSVCNEDQVYSTATNATSEKNQSGEENVIFIHQVTDRQSAQEDVGFVMWPSAVVLSHWLVYNPSVVHGKRILELGAGCGLVGLVAAHLQIMQLDEQVREELASRATVFLSDNNKTVLKNLERNVALNNVAEICQVVGLDFCRRSGIAGKWKDLNECLHDQCDVVLAADMICQPEDAIGVANIIHDVLRPDGRAFAVCADASHRFGVGHFAGACRRAGLEVSVEDVKDICNGELISEELQHTSGYVEGMNLKMFTINKLVH